MISYYNESSFLLMIWCWWDNISNGNNTIHCDIDNHVMLWCMNVAIVGSLSGESWTWPDDKIVNVSLLIVTITITVDILNIINIFTLSDIVYVKIFVMCFRDFDIFMILCNQSSQEYGGIPAVNRCIYSKLKQKIKDIVLFNTTSYLV